VFRNELQTNLNKKERSDKHYRIHQRQRDDQPFFEGCRCCETLKAVEEAEKHETLFLAATPMHYFSQGPGNTTISHLIAMPRNTERELPQHR